MQYVDATAPLQRAAFVGWTRPMGYISGGDPMIMLPAFVRGIRSDDLFNAALQTDNFAQIDVIEFRKGTAANSAALTPRRYDRLIINPNAAIPTSYAVEEFRGAPNDLYPVFFKLLLRGGQQ